MTSMDKRELSSKYDFERCEFFAADFAAQYPNVEHAIVNGEDFEWTGKLRPCVSGPSEAKVRERQVSKSELNADNLLMQIKQENLQGNPGVYLNWGDCSCMVKVSYDSFVCCDKVIDIAWNPVADDLDIIIPHHFVYCLDHHDHIWYQSL